MAEWRKCNSCKKTISFGQVFWVCNVSTCNRRRTCLRFCSVSCYDAHVPGMNHRDTWALEVKAPTAEQWAKYAAEQGEDAVWPAPQKEKPKEEAALPSGGFGDTKSASSTVVVRRRKS